MQHKASFSRDCLERKASNGRFALFHGVLLTMDKAIHVASRASSNLKPVSQIQRGLHMQEAVNFTVSFLHQIFFNYPLYVYGKTETFGSISQLKSPVFQRHSILTHVLIQISFNSQLYRWISLKQWVGAFDLTPCLGL